MSPTDLFTPYRRTIIDEQRTPYLIDDNTDTYRMFALRTQMTRYLNDGEYVAYRGVEYGDSLWTVMNIMEGGERLELTPERTTELQEKIDDFIDSGSTECVLYKTDDDRVTTWPFPAEIRAHYENGVVYADLSSVANYSEVHANMNIGIHYSLVV